MRIRSDPHPIDGQGEEAIRDENINIGIVEPIVRNVPVAALSLALLHC